MGEGEPVQLYLYDLSRGMAKHLSADLLGTRIDAIWHTGVVVYGEEFFFGGGIQRSRPAATEAGSPDQIIPLGNTEIPKSLFEEFLQEIAPKYTMETYNIMTNNCNNFSNEVVNFLLGKSIPQDILDLPGKVAATPMGQMLLPFLNAIQDAVPGRSTATPPPPSQSQYLQQQRKDGVTAEHLQAAMTGLGLPQQQQAAPSAAATSRTPAGEEDDEERERIKSNSDLAASQVLNPMVAPRAGMVMFSSLAQFQDFINRPFPTVVDFSSQGCPPCRMIAPTYASLCSSLGRTGCISGAAVDTQTQRDIAQFAGITATPTFLFYLQGRVVDTLRGADVNGLRQKMAQHAKRSTMIESSSVAQQHIDVCAQTGAAEGLFFVNETHSPVLYMGGDAAKIVAKLNEFRAKLENSDVCPDASIGRIEKFLKDSAAGPLGFPLSLAKADLAGLWNLLLALPADHVFPCFDLLRLIALRPRGNEAIVHSSHGRAAIATALLILLTHPSSELIDLLKDTAVAGERGERAVPPSKEHIEKLRNGKAVKVVALRFLNNVFSQKEGRLYLLHSTRTAALTAAAADAALSPSLQKEGDEEMSDEARQRREKDGIAEAEVASALLYNVASHLLAFSEAAFEVASAAATILKEGDPKKGRAEKNIPRLLSAVLQSCLCNEAVVDLLRAIEFSGKEFCDSDNTVLRGYGEDLIKLLGQ